MAMLFVSYSRDDRQLSDSVLADLDALGHEVWVDEKLSGGQVWWDEILATIRRSDAFLFLLTPSSVESEACLCEAEYARSLQRPIIPVELVATDPLLVPSVLGQHQIVRYLSGDKADTIALTRALVHADMGRPLPEPLPPEPELPGTYYSELRQQIASREQLGIDEQLGLLQRLKARAEAGGAAEVIPLLATLRAREDVYAVVASGIDQLATSLAPPSSEAADAAPARPPRIRPPRTGLERTAAAAAAASLLLALGGLLSNKLYTESDSTEWFWGERTEDVRDGGGCFWWWGSPLP
jgi:TIR domain